MDFSEWGKRVTVKSCGHGPVFEYCFFFFSSVYGWIKINSNSVLFISIYHEKLEKMFQDRDRDREIDGYRDWDGNREISHLSKTNN